MSSKAQFSKFILALFLTFCFSNSFALGLGLSSGSGSEDWEDNELDNRHDGDREVSNFGFVLDTNTAKNRVFNYRFSLLAEENTADPGFLDMEGIAMTHDFGFSVFRNRVVRLWLGPQLKVGFYGDLSTDNSNAELDGDVVGFNFGPAFGVNIHLPKVVTFSLTYSYYIVGFYGGEYDLNAFSSYLGTYDVDADSTGSVLTASILFRIRDDY